MDGASRMFAVPSEITLGGTTYKVKGKISRLYGEMEARIMAARPDPFKVAEEATKRFPDPVSHKLILDAAMEKACQARFVTRIELAEWMNTNDGTLFVTWLCVRDNDPEYLTLEKVTDLYFEECDKLTAELLEQDNDLDPTDAEQKALDHMIRKTHDTINKASGSDELGNSTGPETTEAKTTTIAPGNINPSPGDESSEILQKPTDSPLSKSAK